VIIAHVISNLDSNIGGAETYVMELALAQASTGKKVFLITTAFTPAIYRQMNEGGVTVIKINRWRPYTPGSKGSNLVYKAVFHLLDLLDSVFRRDIRDLVGQEKIDVLHWHRFQGTGVNSQKTLRTVVVATVHDHSILNTSSLWDSEGRTHPNGLRLKLLKFIMRGYSLVIFPTEKVRETHLNAGFDLNTSQHSIVLGHGWKIPTSKKSYVRQEPMVDAISFLYLGSLSEQKGLPFLLDCWERKQQTKSTLTIAGAGPLAETVKKRKLRNVKVEGWVEGEHKSKLLLEHHAIIIPSQTAEVFCLVAAEASISGLAVICSDLSMPPYLEDKESCFVFRADDGSKLISIMEDCERSPDKLSEMASYAKKQSSSLDFAIHERSLSLVYERALLNANKEI
jgi:glycosyltransferase involved in cell wall biosynthesis